MSKKHHLPFWHAFKPETSYDISRLHPAIWPKRLRFETEIDVNNESVRSASLLRSGNGDQQGLADELDECRAGDVRCNLPACPICSRAFRRWFTAELLRVTEHKDDATTLTILLKKAPRGQLSELNLAACRDLLRKRVQRNGLNDIPVIGGFEVAYQDQAWILHAHLVIIDAQEEAIENFKATFENSQLQRPTFEASLKDRPKQLSYLLKFGTYHRPFQQIGPGKSPAKPLNPPEHRELVQWMSGYKFTDFLFLSGARRFGSEIRLKADDQPAA